MRVKLAYGATGLEADLPDTAFVAKAPIPEEKAAARPLTRLPGR